LGFLSRQKPLVLPSDLHRVHAIGNVQGKLHIRQVVLHIQKTLYLPYVDSSHAWILILVRSLPHPPLMDIDSLLCVPALRERDFHLVDH